MDYVTRKELRDVETALRQDIRDTEDKLRNEFTDALRYTHSDLARRLDNQDNHLDDQDELIRASARWPKYQILGVATFLSFVSWLALHALHIG